MRPPTPQAYLETQVRTASPLQLVLMLYDGCLKFCQMATDNFEANNADLTHSNLVKAQRIVIELACALDAEANKEVSANLGSLYAYMYRLLVNANVEQDMKGVQDTMELLRTVRSAWQEIESQDKRPATGTGDSRPGGGLSIEG